MAETSDKPTAELERDLGLSPDLVRKWQQHYRVQERSVGPQLSEESEAEVESAVSSVSWKSHSRRATS